MELRQIRYFLKAKEVLNFTLAAELLNISQSTLSQQIRQLENELNVPLFNRIGRRIVLTEAGALFYEYAGQSLRKANEGLLALRDLNNVKTGKITIGVIYSMRILFAKALARFAKEYPAIEIRVVFGTTKDLVDKLNAHYFDFIITFYEGARYPHLKFQKLLTARMVLVTAKKSPLAHKASISLEEVAELPLALPFSGYSTIQFFTDSFKLKNLKPHICMEINDIPTLFEVVKIGHWHTILSETSVNDPDVISIPIKGKDMLRNIMFMSLKDAYEKKAMKKFYEILKKV